MTVRQLEGLPAGVKRCGGGCVLNRRGKKKNTVGRADREGGIPERGGGGSFEIQKRDIRGREKRTHKEGEENRERKNQEEKAAEETVGPMSP